VTQTVQLVLPENLGTLPSIFWDLSKWISRILSRNKKSGSKTSRKNKMALLKKFVGLLKEVLC